MYRSLKYGYKVEMAPLLEEPTPKQSWIPIQHFDMS